MKKILSIIVSITLFKHLINQKDNPEELRNSEPPIALPFACKDYDLVALNPKSYIDPLEQLLNSRIIIFGETHNKCEEASHSCAKSLLEMKAQNEGKKIDPKKTTMLFEEWSKGDKVLCKEHGFHDLSRDCGGWNIDYENRKKIDILLMKSKVMETMSIYFINQWSVLLTTVNREQLPSMATFMINYIQWSRELVQQSERSYEKFKRKYGQKNPNLRTKKSINLKAARFRLKQAKKFFKESKENPEALSNLNYLTTEANKYMISAEQCLEDPEIRIRTPNRVMFWAINNKTIETEKTVFVFAGLQHINKTSDYSQELYEALDEHADEHSYAVLSCKL